MLTCAGMMAAPALAKAQDAAATDAQTRFEEGLTRVRRGDFVSARVSFAQAYAVLRKPRILWNLALCEEKTGRLLDALTHFKQVERDPATLDADRANARLHVNGLATQIGHVDAQAPPGVTLTVDGGPLSAVAPLSEPLDVPPGHHVIEAKLEEGTKALGVDAPAGQIAHVTFLSLDASSPPSGPAPIPVVAPTVPAPLVGANEPVASAVPRSEAPQGRSVSVPRVITGAAIGGSAVVAVVLGAYFGARSQSDADTAAGFRRTYGASACSSPMGALVATCGQWNDAVKSQNREATASIGLYVAGGALALGAVATWFLWPTSTERTAAALWVAPAIGPGVAAARAGGAF